MSVGKILTDEEDKEMRQLVDELSDVCNNKIPRLIRRLRLKTLKKFNVSVAGITFEFACDDETFDVLKSRTADDKTFDYIG